MNERIKELRKESLNSNLILLIQILAGVADIRAYLFKFQSDSINTKL